MFLKAKILFFALIAHCLALAPTSYLTTSDKDKLKTVLDKSLLSNELSQIFYGSASFSLLKLEVPDKQKLCTLAKNEVKPKLTPELLYYASSIAKTLGCPLTPPTGVRQLMNDAIKDDSTLLNVFHAVSVLKNFGMEPEEAKVLKFIQQAMKKDDTILGLGYAFHIGAQLKGDTRAIFERIEDVIVQADEIDGHMLQFEGGLSITAFVLSGVYKLAEASKKPIPMKKDQAVKFANYLMSRKSVQSPKGAYYLLETVNILTNNRFHIPVAITLASQIAVSPDSPKIKLRVTNLLGDTLKQLKVNAVSIDEETSGKAVLSNKAFSPISSDQSLFEVNIMENNLPHGFYNLLVNVEGPDSRFVGNHGVSVTFKVLSAVSIEDVKFGVVDVEQSGTPLLGKITYPSSINHLVKAEYHQRVILTFAVKDSHSKQAVKIHQAFVKITYLDSPREIIYIAEQENGDTYKFEMDVSASAKEFGGLSGKYSLELILGDACISNSISWKLADISLKFSEDQEIKKTKEMFYKPLDEIHHLFRTPDPRPASVVSMTFSVLCLVPLAILLIGWLKLGVNLSNFSFSLSTLGFHFGLGAIFALFCLFWLQLNMFTTLRYLVAVGGVTFLCGNSMLSSMAQKRNEK